MNEILRDQIQTLFGAQRPANSLCRSWPTDKQLLSLQSSVHQQPPNLVSDENIPIEGYSQGIHFPRYQLSVFGRDAQSSSSQSIFAEHTDPNHRWVITVESNLTPSARLLKTVPQHVAFAFSVIIRVLSLGTYKIKTFTEAWVYVFSDLESRGGPNFAPNRRAGKSSANKNATTAKSIQTTLNIHSWDKLKQKQLERQSRVVLGSVEVEPLIPFPAPVDDNDNNLIVIDTETEESEDDASENTITAPPLLDHARPLSFEEFEAVYRNLLDSTNNALFNGFKSTRSGKDSGVFRSIRPEGVEALFSFGPASSSSSSQTTKVSISHQDYFVDMGCGTGLAVAQVLLRSGCTVHGVELDDKLVQLGNQYIKNNMLQQLRPLWASQFVLDQGNLLVYHDVQPAYSRGTVFWLTNANFESIIQGVLKEFAFVMQERARAMADPSQFSVTLITSDPLSANSRRARFQQNGSKAPDEFGFVRYEDGVKQVQESAQFKRFQLSVEVGHVWAQLKNVISDVAVDWNYSHSTNAHVYQISFNEN
jgi:hypothetical protein